MKKNLSILLIGAFAMFLVGVAQAATITTGGKQGNYFKVGVNLAKMIGGEVVASNGSIENLDRLTKGEADIGFVQADALAYYADKHPEAKNQIESIGPLYEECTFIVVNASSKSKIKNEDDLQSTKGTIAVGAEGSGSAVTWDYMRKLEPGYAKARVVFEGGIRTLGKIASAPDGEVNAMLFTIKPDPTNKMFQTVAQNKDLKFIDVDDSDLNDKFPMTGKPIYNFRTVPVTGGIFKSKVTTPCMEALVVARSEMEPDELDNLADKVLNYRNSITGE